MAGKSCWYFFNQPFGVWVSGLQSGHNTAIYCMTVESGKVVHGRFGRGRMDGRFLVLEAQTLSLTLQLEPDGMAVLCQEDYCCAPGCGSKQLFCWTWLFSNHLQHSPGAGFKCPSLLDFVCVSSEGFCVLGPCFSWIHGSPSPWTTAWYPVLFMLFLACCLTFFSHSAGAYKGLWMYITPLAEGLGLPLHPPLWTYQILVLAALLDISEQAAQWLLVVHPRERRVLQRLASCCCCCCWCFCCSKGFCQDPCYSSTFFSISCSKQATTLTLKSYFCFFFNSQKLQNT